MNQQNNIQPQQQRRLQAQHQQLQAQHQQPQQNRKGFRKTALLAITSILAFGTLLAGCGGSQSASGSASGTIKVGVSGTDTRIWDYVAKKAEAQGLHVEVVKFSDYVLPNTALAEGDLDMNAFQTVAYFNAFKKEHNLDLAPLATTVLAPMGVYSQKYKKLSDIPDGGKIAVPNDVTNEARALLLLQEGGLIKLKKDFGLKGTPNDIVDNPKHLQFSEMVAAQTPRVLPDVAASIINNGVAVDAKFNPLTDSIFHESATAKPYINILAVRTKDKDRADLKKLAQIYQSDDVKKFIEDTYKGAEIPTFVPVSEVENIGA